MKLSLTGRHALCAWFDQTCTQAVPLSTRHSSRLAAALPPYPPDPVTPLAPHPLEERGGGGAHFSRNHFWWKTQLFASLLAERAWKRLVRHALTVLRAAWQANTRTQGCGFTWFNRLHESLTRNMSLPCSMVKCSDLHWGGRGPKTISQGLHKNVCELCQEKKTTTCLSNGMSDETPYCENSVLYYSKYLRSGSSSVTQEVVCSTFSGLLAKDKARSNFRLLTNPPTGLEWEVILGCRSYNNQRIIKHKKTSQCCSSWWINRRSFSQIKQ